MSKKIWCKVFSVIEAYDLFEAIFKNTRKLSNRQNKDIYSLTPPSKTSVEKKLFPVMLEQKNFDKKEGLSFRLQGFGSRRRKIWFFAASAEIVRYDLVKLEIVHLPSLLQRDFVSF